MGRRNTKTGERKYWGEVDELGSEEAHAPSLFFLYKIPVLVASPVHWLDRVDGRKERKGERTRKRERERQRERRIEWIRKGKKRVLSWRNKRRKETRDKTREGGGGSYVIHAREGTAASFRSYYFASQCYRSHLSLFIF